jgi:hypothetical protein
MPNRKKKEKKAMRNSLAVMKGKGKKYKDDCSLLPFLVEETVRHPVLLLDIKERKILQTHCFLFA